MSRFEIQNLPLAGLKRVTRKAHSDARGFISRLFCDAELAEAGWHGPIRQINHARTVRSGPKLESRAMASLGPKPLAPSRR